MINGKLKNEKKLIPGTWESSLAIQNKNALLFSGADPQPRSTQM